MQTLISHYLTDGSLPLEASSSTAKVVATPGRYRMGSRGRSSKTVSGSLGNMTGLSAADRSYHTILAGDNVIMRGFCSNGDGIRLGFGECAGLVLPADKV